MCISGSHDFEEQNSLFITWLLRSVIKKYLILINTKTKMGIWASDMQHESTYRGDEAGELATAVKSQQVNCQEVACCR